MIRPGEAAKTVRTLLDACLRRDPVEALACLTERVQWAGPGSPPLALERGQALRSLLAALPQEAALPPGPGAWEETPLSAEAVQLTAPVSGPGERLRLAALCVREGDGACRAAALSLFAPGGQGEAVYPAGLSRPEMDRQLGQRALDILGRSIPGGMMGGYLEPGFPLYYVNDRMLAHLGYTYEEFVAATGGSVLNCMHPDDRSRVDALVEEAFRTGTGYEVRYRMRRRDGSYIWVNDVGKKGLSADGRAVCISVIRDVTGEMEARARLESQAARYDALFQSVLCGIVQYRLQDGGVAFKNANREAIRIFGYTPEDFWAKADWDLPSLIAPEDRARVLEEVSRLRRPGDVNPFEYRVLRRDGSLCWIIGRAEVILDTDGEQIVQSVYLDINEQKKAEQRSARLEEQVEASSEILHLALEHTTVCEFHYDPRTRVCTVPERTCAIYRCRPRYEQMPESFAREMVAEPFRPAFYEMYERIHRGERTATCEFLGAGGAFWCRETLSVTRCGEDGTPLAAVGVVEDITRQREMERALEDARSRDALTGLYNRESGVRLVQEHLAGRGPADPPCALLLLDMDDFGELNRQEGRVFADAILQEVADLLRAETGPADLQVRLGGDEFLLLLKGAGKAQATVIGPRIAGLVRGLLANTERDVHVSVSIGMCSTEVIGEYHALYRCAESTLEYVKAHGKGQAACYLDTSNEVGILLTELYTEEHRLNDIALGAARTGEDLTSFALDLLGRSKNLDDAVKLLLARVGRTCGFDRVSIIEADRAYLSWRFSYQWARRRADLQLGQTFYVSQEDFDLCSDMYDEEGLADHNVRDGISHIQSCLHAGIWDYGVYVGSMSFEVDRPDFPWTPRHRKLLKELVKVVPSFIMKSKADAVSQAKTDFLSRMSHEIRTPMNAISGMTTIAMSVVDDPVKTLDCLRKIDASNAYLTSLINDILDMSRIESGKLELCCGALDLSQLLSSLGSLFHAQAAEKGLALSIRNGCTAGRPLWADGLRLNQVLVNIIGNAIKFTDQGGVLVRVEALEEEPRATLRFSVEDTGVGIDPAAMARIFRPFEQAEASTAVHRGGTGLGLAISSRLVQMMGGALAVRSQPGQGSAFSFTLTMDYAPAEAVRPAAPAPALPRRDFKGCRVLLAEDNALNREIAQTILEMNGFSVTCAADGQEALDIFCAEAPGRFDAVLMDIRMPVMDGLESARRIRTSGRPDARTVPILALSANAFDEDSKKSLASGMDAHLSKPLQVEELLDALERCIRRREAPAGEEPGAPPS